MLYRANSVGTAAEHHTLYQYQFSFTKNLITKQIQTEAPYYRPSPAATTNSSFSPVGAFNDLDVYYYYRGRKGNCGDAWALCIITSQDLLFYSAGLYSFFDNYSTTCSNYSNGETCPTQIFGIDRGGGISSVFVYNLNKIGATSIVDRNDRGLARFSDNIGNFADTIARIFVLVLQLVGWRRGGGGCI